MATATGSTTRRNASVGGLDQASINVRMATMGNYLAGQIRSRSSFLQMLPAADRSAHLQLQ